MAKTVPSSGFFSALNWAVYLGCSWTWCIGMFLPVILVSEFGITAWFVFAIPNVIGAAAMGWMLAKPGTSERIVSEHRSACVAFSAVTLAFHLFFLYWMTSINLMPMAFAIIAIVAGFGLGLLGRKRIGFDFLLAWLVLIISLAVFGRGLMHPVFGVTHPVEIQHLSTAMIGLAPICLFGFLFCPYLDVTFHRARQQTSPHTGKLAYGLGFGLIFLLMIVLTLMYSGDFALDQMPGDLFGSFGFSLLTSAVMLHIAGQIGFTFAAHLRALPPVKSSDRIIWAVAAVMVAVAIFALRQQTWFSFPGLTIQMLTGNFIYRLFMSFYGLVFPAYVWICMVPIRGKAPGITRQSMGVVVMAVVVASPLYWIGFINERMLWLIPAVMIPLLARAYFPLSQYAWRGDRSQIDERTK